MPVLSRAILGRAFTVRDEEFVQTIIVIDEDREPATDEDFDVVVEFVEE